MNFVSLEQELTKASKKVKGKDAQIIMASLRAMCSVLNEEFDKSFNRDQNIHYHLTDELGFDDMKAVMVRREVNEHQINTQFEKMKQKQEIFSRVKECENAPKHGFWKRTWQRLWAWILINL